MFTAPAPEAPLDPIANIDFFPEIDPSAARNTMRLDGTVTNPRLREALLQAMAWTNRQLRDWRTAQQAAGFATLADVPPPDGESIGGESELLGHYRRAVYSYAAGTLTERYRGYDATQSAHKRADTTDPTIDDLARDARWAVKDIMGLSRTVVELI